MADVYGVLRNINQELPKGGDRENGVREYVQHAHKLATREDVVWAYREFLNRTPESEQMIHSWLV